MKRESERRQRDRGDRTGNIGIPLTNGLQAPGGAKRLCDDDLEGSQKFEVISSSFLRFYLLRSIDIIYIRRGKIFLYLIMVQVTIKERLSVSLFRAWVAANFDKRSTMSQLWFYFALFSIDLFLEGSIGKGGRRVADDSRSKHSPADGFGRRAVPKKHVLTERFRRTAATAAWDSSGSGSASSQKRQHARFENHASQTK